MNENLKDIYTHDELIKLSIHELRNLGRDLGVVAPTSLKKEDLVNKIIEIIYGHRPERKIGQGRGRPPKVGRKPCKIYLSMLEQLEEPSADEQFLGQSKEKSLKFDLGLQRVASPRREYLYCQENDEALKTGIVSEIDGKFFVKKLKYLDCEQNYEIPDSLAKDYGLHDYDLIDYLLDDEGKKVEQIIKINTEIATKIMPQSRQNSESLSVCDYDVKTNSSNILFVPTKRDREILNDALCREFEEHGYGVVNVLYDRFDDQPFENRINIYCAGTEDEYETIAAMEAGIEKAIYVASSGKKAVLVVDNLGWLMSVVNTFPKYLYGNLIAKLGRLSDDKRFNITTVCVVSKVGEDDKKMLLSEFDNVKLD